MCLTTLQKNNYYLFELFVVFRLLALMLPTIAKGLLIQDKICLFSHNQSVTFCSNIHLPMNSSDDETVKDVVLAEAAQFGSYATVIESIAMIVWSLFVGSFLDKFFNATFVIMSLNIFGDLISAGVYLATIYFYDSSVYFILLASASTWLSGGIMSFNATAYRYIAINTEEKYRAIKFIILEIIFVIDVSFSTFLSGELVSIQMSPSSTILRTYYLNFLLTILIVLGLYILLFALYKIVQKRHLNEKQRSIEISIIEINNNGQPNSAIDSLDEIAVKSVPEQVHSKQFLNRLFDLENVKQTVHCFVKRRKHNTRLQIYLLCSVLFNQVLVTNGLNTVLLQFSEKVYQWNGAQYGTYSAIQQIAQMGLLGLLLAVLVRWLKLQNGTLILMSQISIFFTDLIRGVFLSPVAFFVSVPIGSLTGVGAISIKTKLSAIIDQDEIGKIFSVSSTIEAMVPFAASLIYSCIFSLSISSHPGVIYLFSCVVMLVSIILMVVERCCCPVQSISQINS